MLESSGKHAACPSAAIVASAVSMVSSGDKAKMEIYSAKWVVPMDGAPTIEDGEVVVDDGFISAVRRSITPANERRDLGNAILLPGLINGHTHLEYTALRGFLEDVPFFPWIRSLMASKEKFDSDDWILSAKLGALECLSAGITSIGDNTDSGAAMDAAVWSGLRGRIYQEFFCIDQRMSTLDVLTDLHKKLEDLNRRKGNLLDVGISPHATYTINPQMFRAIREDSLLRDQAMSIHVAESLSESELIEFGRGEFAQMFVRRGIEWRSPGMTPTEYVSSQGILGKRTLLIHGVHQSESDIELSAKSGAAIIHCPKSNAKLGAGVAPLTRWLATPEMRLGIGTDSAVSNNSLDLFEEMRFGLLMQRGTTASVEGVTANDMLQLATLRGAEALEIAESAGSLTVGKRADMIAIGLDGIHLRPAINPVQTVVYSARASDVKLTVIDGRVCYDGGVYPDIDMSQIIQVMNVLKEKASRVGN